MKRIIALLILASILATGCRGYRNLAERQRANMSNPYVTTAWYPAGMILNRDHPIPEQLVEPPTRPAPVEEIIIPEKIDTIPNVQWQYLVEYSDTDPEVGVLVAKATVKKGFDLLSERNQPEPFKSTAFIFEGNTNDFEKTGDMVADRQPLQKNVPITEDDGTQKQVAITYYNDEVTFRQPIRIKNSNDFTLSAAADYVLNDGRSIDPATGRPVGADNAARDRAGNVVRNADGSIVMDPDGVVARDAAGNVIRNADGNVVRDPDGVVAKDAAGNVIRNRAGNVIMGTPVTDAAGNTIKDAVRDSRGNVVRDANGNVLRVAAAGNNNLAVANPNETPVELIVHGRGDFLRDGTPEWSFEIDRTEDDPTKGFIVAKAILKDGYQMPVDVALRNLNSATAFLFDSPEDFELAGDLMADPAARTKRIAIVENGVRKTMLVSYYQDSVTFRQPVVLKNLDDFDILGDAGYIINNIYYGYDRADIVSEYTRELDLLISIAIKNPNVMFEITAHTDERGAEAYNQALSERRLESVIDYVNQKGLDMSRVIARAAGKSQPLYLNARTDEQHALNRRTTIRMFDPNRTTDMQRLSDEITEHSPLGRDGLWFRVQIGEGREIPRHPYYFFRDHLNAAPGTDLTYYRDSDGSYKFTLGDFTDLDQANRLSNRISDAGNEAIVVAFLNGNPISLSEAEAIFRQQNE
jgi:outer membrane protein OmpA-like peptidoglycan-associated protein